MNDNNSPTQKIEDEPLYREYRKEFSLTLYKELKNFSTQQLEDELLYRENIYSFLILKDNEEIQSITIKYFHDYD